MSLRRGDRVKTVEVRGLITNLPPVEKLEPRTFEVYRRGEDRSKAVCLDTNHPAYEPFSFPLLFPYGESGWGIDSGGAYMRDQNGKRISCLKYTRMRYFQDRRFNDPLLGSCAGVGGESVCEIRGEPAPLSALPNERVCRTCGSSSGYQKGSGDWGARGEAQEPEVKIKPKLQSKLFQE